MNFNNKRFSNLLFTFLFLLPFGLNASDNPPANADNNCLLHLDKSFYVTGEIVWYKLYLSADFKDKPISVRALVLDGSGTIQHSSFLKTEGKTYVEGYYKIPFNFRSGMYLLRFSGMNKASKEPVNLVETQLPIYNDLEGIAQNASRTESNMSATAAKINSELDIQIQLPKTTFTTREKVQPVITVKDQNGNTLACNLSVSVVDWEMTGNPALTNITSGIRPDARMVNILEDKIYLTGKVSKETGESHAAKILGAYSEEEDIILYTKANESGDFFLSVADFHGDRSFQLLADPNEYEKISAQKITQLPVNDMADLLVDEKITSYLVNSRQRKKIFQRYGSVESQLETGTYRRGKKSTKPDLDFIIREYEDFEFMSIFFKENLTPLRFQFNKRDSLYSARMYNPKNQAATISEKFYSGKPLILIDGLATRDGNFLARMRMSDIEKVELFYDLKKLNRQFKVFGSGGVTKITTYEKIKSLPVFEAENLITINGLQKKAAFSSFNPTQINNNRLQPFFKPQIYWNGALEAKKDGIATFEYFQTDDRSEFRIQVIAQSEDGRIGVGEVIYTVK